MAAMKQGRLIHTKGYGVDEEGHQIEDTTLFPASSASKSITAVAILTLVQDGKLDLSQKVFGHAGILHMLKPVTKDSIDPRLHDITVSHLLHHSGGWDLNKSPLYDPMLNEVYIKRGNDVPDIKKIMDTDSPVSYYDTIRYVMSQKLHFTPGTRTVYSNLGYTILGRIIEEISETSYEDYVKRNVINPCGMWHTRIGRWGRNGVLKLDNHSSRMSNSLSHKLGFSIYEALHPDIIDSTLGWYTTVFDMMRFVKCIDPKNGSGILQEEYKWHLSSRESAAPVQHSENWFGAGFRANTKGAIWQDGDPHADDMILFHHRVTNEMPDSWILFLKGRSLKHLKHAAHELMELMDTGGIYNDFIRDMSDIRQLGHDGNNVMVKFAVDEHHLDAFVNAFKRENYDIGWISAYSLNHHRTHFVIIAEELGSSTVGDKDFVLEHGLSEKKLFTRKLELESDGYNMTFLQNYKSASHDSTYVFLAIFRKQGYAQTTQMKFGIHHYPRPYDKLLGLYTEKAFYPTVQSYIKHNYEGKISFIFVKEIRPQKIRFKTYHGLSEKKLGKVVKMNARYGRKLAYIDASTAERTSSFSAVFTTEQPAVWLFKLGLDRDDVIRLILDKQPDELFPKRIVAYTNKLKQLKFVVYLERRKN